MFAKLAAIEAAQGFFLGFLTKPSPIPHAILCCVIGCRKEILIYGLDDRGRGCIEFMITDGCANGYVECKELELTSLDWVPDGF